ncbi:MAG: lipid II flippase Amj family protein [Vulcanimicrobiaceae bacterium]
MIVADAPGIVGLALISPPRRLDTFWSVQLVLAMVLNAFLQAVQVGAYAARLAGVQTGRIGTSISLFNLFVTASRFANMFYAPLLGSISDTAGRTAVAVPALAAAQIAQFEWQIRGIVAAGTIGTLAGAILLPTFVYLFVRGVAAFERRGSIPRSLARLGDPRVIAAVLRTVRLPSPALLRRFSFRAVPLKLLVGNVVVTAIQAIAVVAAYEASILRPDVARTALSASGLVNGIATIAFAIIVDPTSAYIVDQAARGERSVEDVRAMVFYLALTFVLGTLASQIILYPAALFIGSAAHYVFAPH